MIALCIIFGIILLFALVLSIRAHVHVEYENELTAYAKWTFLKIPLLPLKEKEPKPKKEKNRPKEEKKEEKDNKEETPKEETKPKGANPFKKFYENEKLRGVIDLLKRLLAVTGKFGRRFIKSFVIDEMFLDISVSKDDAAATAEEYGKVCRQVFPLMGAVCANCDVRKYSVDVSPDYIGKGHNELAFSLEISLNPRKLINAILAFAFGALFKVVIRFIKGLSKKGEKTPEKKSENTETADENKGTSPEKQVVSDNDEKGSEKDPEKLNGNK